MSEKEPIPIHGNNVTVPHLGVSLRVLLSAIARQHVKGRRRHYRLHLKDGTHIGELSIKDNHETEPKTTNT